MGEDLGHGPALVRWHGAYMAAGSHSHATRWGSRRFNGVSVFGPVKEHLETH